MQYRINMELLKKYEGGLIENNLNISLDVLHKMLDNIINNKEISAISLSTLLSINIIEENKDLNKLTQLNS